MNKSKTTKRPGADRRWTLLFIGDHGNVITLKHFKAIMIGVGSLFFLAVVFAAVLFFQNQGILQQNNDLQKRFADSKKQIEKLRHEKEILMARLVRAEANKKESVAVERPIPQEKKVAQPTAAPPQVASKPKSVEAVKKKPAVPQAALPKPAPTETDEAEPVIRVAVENFKVLRESGNKNLNAQFKIKNTSTGTQPQRVDGRIVVVLKAHDLQANQWLVMPAVGLAGDKPSGKRGKNLQSAQLFRSVSNCRCLCFYQNRRVVIGAGLFGRIAAAARSSSGCAFYLGSHRANAFYPHRFRGNVFERKAERRTPAKRRHLKFLRKHAVCLLRPEDRGQLSKK
jgi:hypothetical protein